MSRGIRWSSELCDTKGMLLGQADKVDLISILSYLQNYQNMYEQLHQKNNQLQGGGFLAI